MALVLKPPYPSSPKTTVLSNLSVDFWMVIVFLRILKALYYCFLASSIAYEKPLIILISDAFYVFFLNII